MPSVFTPQAPPTNTGPGLPPSSHVLPPSATRPAMRPSYPQHPAPAPGFTLTIYFQVFQTDFIQWLMSDLMFLVLSQVSFLISHSSLSLCPLVDPQPSLLQVLLCQLLTYQDPHSSLRHRLMEACPPCLAPGCHRQASCHLPLYPQA